MSDFSGFLCDSCGDVWVAEARTKVTMTFENTDHCDLGSYWKDLCPRCIVEPIGWIPKKRRKANDSPTVPPGFAAAPTSSHS